MKKIFGLLKLALNGSEQEYTSGSINKAIFLLSVPMILEMIMESLFAVVDIFFVSRIGVQAVATVGLTESVLTLIYSVAIGLSMGATAVVSRRVGEKRNEEAGVVIGQVILISVAISSVIGVFGFVYATDILRLMGGDEQLITTGAGYTRLVFASSPVITLLYSLCGALRGAGAASAAMRSLWIANGFNIVLCPLFIFGFGPVPALGVTGAAVATTLGRSFGVIYQLYYLQKGHYGVALKIDHLKPVWEIIRNVSTISAGGTGQFLIASASWVFLTRMLAEFGNEVVAGYTIAIRVIIFTLMPAMGLANAAATLVGQNLGAGQPDRAEVSAWRTARINMVFLTLLAIAYFLKAELIIGWFSQEPKVLETGIHALQILSLGYGFYAFGMVMTSSLNGAGDTRTPTYINLVCFWMIELPLAYVLAMHFNLGPTGVFASVPISESILALAGIWAFRRGRWKKINV